MEKVDSIKFATSVGARLVSHLHFFGAPWGFVGRRLFAVARRNIYHSVWVVFDSFFFAFGSAVLVFPVIHLPLYGVCLL